MSGDLDEAAVKRLARIYAADIEAWWNKRLMMRGDAAVAAEQAWEDGWKAAMEEAKIKEVRHEWSNERDAAAFLVSQAAIGGSDLYEAMLSILKHPGTLESYWKIAMQTASHPVGGSAELVEKVNRARDYIERWRAA